MQCKCGNEIGVMATSCPKCGETYILKTAAIVLGFILVLGGFLIFLMVKYG
jgi:hypothetical protein